MGAGRSPMVTGGARSKTLGQLAPSIRGVLTQKGVGTPMGGGDVQGQKAPSGPGEGSTLCGGLPRWLSR